jgi:ubiquinone/menaquinone biosynthesis C-methylase UbiE
MKIELGGGVKPRGDGFLNVDKLECADIRFDLNQRPWTFVEPGSVSELYTAHCLEHVDNPTQALVEIARICRVGATVEVRVPMPGSDLAMVWDHKSVISPIHVLNMDRHFPGEYWTGERKLSLQRIAYEPSILLDEAIAEMPFLRHVSREAVMKWIPRTCHECRYYWIVESV